MIRLGLIEQPIALLYTEFAIIIGSVYLFLPTMVMTLVGVMENIEKETLEAAETLGASPFKRSIKLSCRFVYLEDRWQYFSIYRHVDGLYDTTTFRWEPKYDDGDFLYTRKHRL